MVKPPVAYFGGKTSLAERLAGSFPPHRHYVEPCAGSLAVLLAKTPSRQETVNDLDSRLMTFWRVLRDRPADLERVCSLTPHSRMERDLAQTIPGDLDDLEVARRVWVSLTQGRTATLARSGWVHTTGTVSTPMPVSLARYARRLAPAAARIARVSLECRPVTEMIEAYGGERTSLLYVDPPYRTDPGVRRGGEYGVDMRTEAQHRKLLELCLDAAATVVISGYPSTLYSEVLADWYSYSIPSWTSQGGQRVERTEMVWSNRPLSGLDQVDGDTDLAFDTPRLRTEIRRCPQCHSVIRQPRRGRKRVWCSEACRVAAWRATRDG